MALNYPEIPLNQRITIEFPDDEVGRGVRVVIVDAQDDDAAGNAAAWADGKFDLDDLLFTLLTHAQVEVTEAGVTTHYTGATFDDGGVLVDLDGVTPASVTFEDLETAQPG